MMKNSRYALTAIGLGAVLLLGTGCSATTPAPAAPIASETVSAEPKSSIAGTVVNGIPTKPELAFDGKNYYVQTTIADDDPAMILDMNIVGQKARTLFTPEELKEAQQFATRYVAEEVLDSIMNDRPNDAETATRWLDANKDKFDPTQADDFVEYMNKPANLESFLLRGFYREGKYELVSGPEQTRVLSRTLTPVVIQGAVQNGTSYIEYEVQARVAYKVKLNGQDTVETVDARIQTTLSKKPATGKWVIAGADNKYTPTPVS